MRSPKRSCFLSHLGSYPGNRNYLTLSFFSSFHCFLCARQTGPQTAAQLAPHGWGALFGTPPWCTQTAPSACLSDHRHSRRAAPDGTDAPRSVACEREGFGRTPPPKRSLGASAAAVLESPDFKASHVLGVMTHCFSLLWTETI